MPAAILYRNLADDGTVLASSWPAATPPSLLQNHHTQRRWKGRNGPAEHILLTFSALRSIDTIALLRCDAVVAGTQSPMTSAAITRVRVSTADPTGLDGDLYDSGSAAGRISADYGSLVTLLGAPASALVVRIDLAQDGANSLLAGRLVVGLRDQFTINFDYGWSFGYTDRSRIVESAGGQEFVERDERPRILNVTFASLAEVDRYAFVHEADRLNGINRDVFFITDPQSANLSRDTIWGRMQDMSPPTQPNLAYFSKSYTIRERL